MRHPQWQTDTPLDEMVVEESLGDSLKDAQDTSLRLSVDGCKFSFNASLDYDPIELEKVAAKGNTEVQDQVKRNLNNIKKQSSEGKEIEAGKKSNENVMSTVNKYHFDFSQFPGKCSKWLFRPMMGIPGAR